LPTSRRIPGAFLLAFALAGCAGVPSQGVNARVTTVDRTNSDRGSAATPSQPDAEQRAIAARLAEVSAALVAADPVACAAVFAPDAVYLASGGSPLHGRAAIVEHYRSRLATTIYRSIVITPSDVRRVGDTVYEWGTSIAVTVPRATPDAEPARSGGQYLTVWVLGADGRWYIQSDAPMPRQLSPEERAAP
jgi:uncharacterized protein (TIGR02246 family)